LLTWSLSPPRPAFTDLIAVSIYLRLGRWSPWKIERHACILIVEQSGWDLIIRDRYINFTRLVARASHRFLDLVLLWRR
jgi:hypothetical protein